MYKCAVLLVSCAQIIDPRYSFRLSAITAPEPLPSALLAPDSRRNKTSDKECLSNIFPPSPLLSFLSSVLLFHVSCSPTLPYFRTRTQFQVSGVFVKCCFLLVLQRNGVYKRILLIRT